jgi:[protein-PII] uridylyltransferase
MAGLSLRERRQALLERPTLQGEAFCRRYAEEADAWLSDLAEQAASGSRRHLALLAVGGYGRAELAPFSDLDLVLVHDGRKDVATLADAIWYPVWDEGVHLDHSVRRPAEVLGAAEDDLRVALGLLDGRLVWGDPVVAEPLLEKVRARWAGGLGARWLPTLRQQMEERHRAQGDVAFLLEPDLKEGRGGLRDATALRALSRCAPTLADQVDLGSAARAAATLVAVRVELHRRAGRELDRLLLQEQDHIAAVLGYGDADALMASVSEAGRTIAWVVDGSWRRQARWLPPAASRRRRLRRPRSPASQGSAVVPEPGAPVLEVEPGVVIRAGEVGLADGAGAGDSSLGLRVAAVAAEQGLPVARAALNRLADKLPPPGDPWPTETREALVRVLRQGHRAIEPLEALDHHDLLSRTMPEWAAVRHKPQRNAYHRFTVDRHLLEAAANAAALADRVERPDLLLVGTLLHDIGKGYPGDHTAVGVDLVGAITRRMGFSDDDVETLVAMCAHHLLLPDTATRRDLDDPATIEAVATAAGDHRTLDLLWALTEVDSQATGPAAWGSWKAGLVADLVDRARRSLGGEAPAAGRRWRTDEHLALMADVRRTGKPVVLLDPPHVVVAAPDRRGLLASVAGTLALHGLDVRTADVTGEDGVAAEEFTVEAARGSWPDSARLREDLDAVLADRIALRDRLEAKAHAYAGSRRPSTARPIVPQVHVDNAASASSTVVEIRALDEVGLLRQVTQALFDAGLDVVSARVSTIGDEVVDAFYVRDAAGGKVTDPATLERVREALRAAIA